MEMTPQWEHNCPGPGRAPVIASAVAAAVRDDSGHGDEADMGDVEGPEERSSLLVGYVVRSCHRPLGH